MDKTGAGFATPAAQQMLAAYTKVNPDDRRLEQAIAMGTAGKHIAQECMDEAADRYEAAAFSEVVGLLLVAANAAEAVWLMLSDAPQDEIEEAVEATLESENDVNSTATRTGRAAV